MIIDNHASTDVNDAAAHAVTPATVPTSYRSVQVDGLNIAYREAGDRGNPKLVLLHAGTEVNEEPGLGPNQAHRQTGPNTGPDEHGTVRMVSDRFSYPKTADVVRVTIKPATNHTATR
jgi:hypothetical protein